MEKASFFFLKYMYRCGPRCLLCELVEWQPFPFPLNLYLMNCPLSHCHSYMYDSHRKHDLINSNISIRHYYGAKRRSENTGPEQGTQTQINGFKSAWKQSGEAQNRDSNYHWVESKYNEWFSLRFMTNKNCSKPRLHLSFYKFLFVINPRPLHLLYTWHYGPESCMGYTPSFLTRPITSLQVALCMGWDGSITQFAGRRVLLLTWKNCRCR